MRIKVTIQKNSAAAKAFQAFMEQKEAFRKAAENGKANEYARSNPYKFAQPV